MSTIFVALTQTGGWLALTVASDRDTAQAKVATLLASGIAGESGQRLWQESNQRLIPAGEELIAAYGPGDRPRYIASLRRWLYDCNRQPPDDLPLSPQARAAIWHLWTEWLDLQPDTAMMLPDAEMLFPLLSMGLAGEPEAQEILVELAAVAQLRHQPGRVVTAAEGHAALQRELQEGNPATTAWSRAVAFCGRYTYPPRAALLNLAGDSQAAQLQDLLRTADDMAGDHVLWVDPFGGVHLTLFPRVPPPYDLLEWVERMGGLIKFRRETCIQGNGYVGAEAASDAEYASQLHNELVRLWATDAQGYCE